ncbi:pyocin knob domain-containing protein [Agathobaculum sp. NTUH-O15-33]|uniref:pyocin knob domain-containing protein n=1 Tax=Agathobaculum sp. NTUH-O15-33 TaxID=3079302 RepID=UPI0029587FDB|nr:pyocin knob domain-containing protein [Agathobaculum sp. NTUH-O15-33]WNX85805.1 pyocin knob domain-containing protein [Agathobaculum sp. NTUH-O15-33]
MYRVQDRCTNTPPDIYGYGQMLVIHGDGDTIAQVYFDYNYNQAYLRSGNPPNVGGPGTWSDWVPISTATKPAVYDLPLAAGVSQHELNQCNYYKTQFDEVTASFGLDFVKSEDMGAFLVAVLPEGYRPSKNIEVPASIMHSAGRCAGTAIADPSGGLYVLYDIPSGKAFACATIAFIAA